MVNQTVFISDSYNGKQGILDDFAAVANNFTIKTHQSWVAMAKLNPRMVLHVRIDRFILSKNMLHLGHGRRSQSGWSGFGRTTFLPY